MQNNFTNREQSKRLLEIGVHRSSADCYYSFSDGYKTIHVWNMEICTYKDWSGKEPCWSVGRMMEIIDVCAKIDSSDDIGEEYPSTTKVMKKIGLYYAEYLVKSMERAVGVNTIDFSKLDSIYDGKSLL